MTPADKVRFASVLNGMALMKPGSNKLTPEVIELWWNAMQHWPIDKFEQAASHLTRTVEFMPNPFHFEQLRLKGQPTAGEAWSAVLHAIRTHAEQRPGGRIERAVQAVGGWYAIGHAEYESLPFIEMRFKAAYNELTDVDQARHQLPTIAKSEALTLMHKLTERVQLLEAKHEDANAQQQP